MKYVIILDPRGNVAMGGLDVINRHKKYAQTLENRSVDSPATLKIYSATKSYCNQSFHNELSDNLVLISKPRIFPLLFSIRAIKQMKLEGITPSLLIAGDPWEGAFSAWIVNFGLRKRIPLQIQIHADITDPKWRKLNWKNKLRYGLAKFSLKHATRIRSVSRSQAIGLEKYLGIPSEKIDIAPVPLNIVPSIIEIDKRQVLPFQVGLVGRVHKDRGLETFLVLVKKINLVYQDFHIHIIGDGPELEWIISQLLEDFSVDRIHMHGLLMGEEMLNVWKKLDVLVSCAPVESYGRAIRESIFNGVPVWATLSEGTKSLISEVGEENLMILNVSKNANDLMFDLKSIVHRKIPISTRQKILIRENSSTDFLVTSWIKMMH